MRLATGVFLRGEGCARPVKAVDQVLAHVIEPGRSRCRAREFAGRGELDRNDDMIRLTPLLARFLVDGCQGVNKYLYPGKYLLPGIAWPHDELDDAFPCFHPEK